MVSTEQGRSQPTLLSLFLGNRILLPFWFQTESYYEAQVYKFQQTGLKMLPSWDSRCVKFPSLIGLAFNTPCPLANRTQTILKLHPNWEQINGKLFPNYPQSRHKEMRSNRWKQPVFAFQFCQWKKGSPLYQGFTECPSQEGFSQLRCWIFTKSSKETDAQSIAKRKTK